LNSKRLHKPIAERSLFNISWPILFELLMLYMVPAVDAYYMSRVSDDAVAAVSAVLPVAGLGVVLFMPLSQAGSSIAAQHLGAGHTEKAKRTFSLMLALNLIIGTIMSVLIFTLADKIPRFLGLETNLAVIAGQYIRILSVGNVILALRVGTSGILNALGMTRVNMWSAVLMNLINFAINHVTVTGIWGLPKLGVIGIAAASVTAWMVAFLLGLSVCYTFMEHPRAWRGQLAELKEILRPILNIGLPSALEPFSYQMSQVAISSILVKISLAAVTTKAYVGNISLFSLLWTAAFASGTQIKVSHLLGARDFEGASKQLMIGLKYSWLGCTLSSLLLASLGGVLLPIFTNDPDIIRLGRIILWVAVGLEWGRALNVLVGSSLRASGDARFVAFFGLSVMWCVAVGGSYALGLGLGWGLVGVYIAMSIDEHTRGWVTLYRWRKGYWQSKTLYKRDS